MFVHLPAQELHLVDGLGSDLECSYELGEEVECHPRVLATEHSHPVGSYASSPSLAFSSALVVSTDRVRICRRIENALGRRKTLVLAPVPTTNRTSFWPLRPSVFPSAKCQYQHPPPVRVAVRIPQSWL